MTINELQQMKEKLGYSNETIAALSGVSLEVVEQLLTSELPGQMTYTDRFAIERVLRDSEGEVVREAKTPYLDKKQGEYTLEDYYALPNENRVELIDGVIYDMAAPTLVHQRLAGEIYRVLANFISKKNGSCLPFFAPIDVQLDRDDKTMMQPDVVIVCDRDKTIKRCIYGAPDFIVEILSPSTGRKDVTIKLKKYRDAGVREYWMVDPDKQKVVVYDWSDGEIPTVYGFDVKVPVAIFNGECEVDFTEIYREIAFLY